MYMIIYVYMFQNPHIWFWQKFAPAKRQPLHHSKGTGVFQNRKSSIQLVTVVPWMPNEPHQRMQEKRYSNLLRGQNDRYPPGN